MYLENDQVNVQRVPNHIKQSLAAALDVPFEKIKFYFVDYEVDKQTGEKYAVLSAETLTKFTIVHCPQEYLEDINNKTIDKLCQELLINGALDRYNKTKDLKELELLKELTAPKKEKPASPLKIGEIVEEYDNMWYDDVRDDDDLYYMDDEDDTF